MLRENLDVYGIPVRMNMCASYLAFKDNHLNEQVLCCLVYIGTQMLKVLRGHAYC